MTTHSFRSLALMVALAVAAVIPARSALAQVDGDQPLRVTAPILVTNGQPTQAVQPVSWRGRYYGRPYGAYYYGPPRGYYSRYPSYYDPYYGAYGYGYSGAPRYPYGGTARVGPVRVYWR